MICWVNLWRCIARVLCLSFVHSQVVTLPPMPSARLKLVKLATPSAAVSSSPFCSNNQRAFTVDSRNIVSETFKSGDCLEASSCIASRAVAPLCIILLPPQRHHFSKKSDWFSHYRRWLKNSKAIWLQRLQNQHSILHFFAAKRRGPNRPQASAARGSKAQPQTKLKNTTLEAYGARAGSFKPARCCVNNEK